MNSIILRAGTSYLAGLLLVFSVYMMLRGHNEPGGGFNAGLIVSIAVVMQYKASGVSWASDSIR